MTYTKYAVKLGGRLYVATEMYNLYQATTRDFRFACLFQSYEKAERIARKAHGEVVEVYITDENLTAEIKSLKAELEALR